MSIESWFILALIVIFSVFIFPQFIENHFNVLDDTRYYLIIASRISGIIILVVFFTLNLSDDENSSITDVTQFKSEHTSEQRINN